jgi:hypothetical protein
MDWTMFAYRPLAAHAARRVLIGRLRARRCHEMGRFSRADVDEFLKGAWARYLRRRPDLPPEPTLGSGMNVRLACFPMAFFDELLAGWVERDYAIEIVAGTTWRVYQLWAKIAPAIARVSPWRRTVLGFARVDNDRGARSISLALA